MGLFVVILFTFKKRHQSVRKVPTHGDGLGTKASERSPPTAMGWGPSGQVQL